MAENDLVSPEFPNPTSGLQKEGAEKQADTSKATLEIDQILAQVRNIQSRLDGSVENARIAQEQIEGLIAQITSLAASLPVEKYVALLGDLAKIQTAAKEAVERAKEAEKAHETLVSAVQQAFGKESPYALSQNNSGMEVVDAEVIKAVTPNFGLFQNVINAVNNAVPGSNNITLAQKAAVVAPILQTPQAVASYLGRSAQVQATHTVLTGYQDHQAVLGSLAPQVLTKANIDSFRNSSSNNAFLQQCAAINTALETQVRNAIPEFGDQKLTHVKLSEVTKTLEKELGVTLDPVAKKVIEEKLHSVKVLNENKEQQTIVMVVVSKESVLGEIKSFQDVSPAEILRRLAEGKKLQQGNLLENIQKIIDENTSPQEGNSEKKSWTDREDAKKLAPRGNIHHQI